MTNVCISQNIKSRLKNIKLGCLQYTVNNDINNERITYELSQLYSRLEQNNDEQVNKYIFDTNESIRSLGVSPSKYRGSADALIRRLKKDKQLASIAPLVDINNIISVKYSLPVGSYNLDKISGEIILDIGAADDKYDSLKKEAFSLNNMVILRDEVGPFGSIHADSLRTMVQNSKHIISLIFCFSNDSNYLNEATNEMAKLLKDTNIAGNLDVAII